MKKVYSNTSDVIHLFAQKSQSEARCSNVYFETPWNSTLPYGTELYSYGKHYLLAEFLDEETVLINDEGYSSTTSKHISEARWALSQYKRYYTMETDLILVYRQVKYNTDKLARARKPELYISAIFRLWESLNEFHEYNRRRKKITKRNYIVYSDERYKEIKKIVASLQADPDQYKEKLHNLTIREAKRTEKENKRKVKEALTEFNNYEINSFHIGEYSYLRVSECGNFIETSQNVRVDINEARVLYLRIKQGKDVIGHKIEQYTVISINGTLRIGCHEIQRDEINRIANMLSW